MTGIWQHGMSGVSLEQEHSETQEFKRYIIIIAAIQETRWQGSKIFGIDDWFATVVAKSIIFLVLVL